MVPSYLFLMRLLLLFPSIHKLRSKVSQEHEVLKKKELEAAPKASYGYGGKFGTERDRMDKVRGARLAPCPGALMRTRAYSTLGANVGIKIPASENFFFPPCLCHQLI